jgi:1,4-dihydroxy-2-naphthoyl-CoA hydrolase
MAADLSSLVAMMPFAAETGISLAEAGPDRVVAVLPWAPGLCTSGGILHGGALMTLADSAGALVAFLGLPEGASTATITSTTQLFRSGQCKLGTRGRAARRCARTAGPCARTAR